MFHSCLLRLSMFTSKKNTLARMQLLSIIRKILHTILHLLSELSCSITRKHWKTRSWQNKASNLILNSKLQKEKIFKSDKSLQASCPLILFLHNIHKTSITVVTKEKQTFMAQSWRHHDYRMWDQISHGLSSHEKIH